MTIIIPTWFLIIVILIYVSKVIIGYIMGRNITKTLKESGLIDGISSILLGKATIKAEVEMKEETK